MRADRRLKRTFSPIRFRLGYVATIVIVLNCSLWVWWVNDKYGTSMYSEHELRQVMETYNFGSGMAQLTGDTSVFSYVVTERVLQRRIDHCSKGLCVGVPPPHVIGDYFKVVKMTDEFAVVELEERPLMNDLDGVRSSFLRRCYSLVRDGEHWRVSGMYLDCDGYLPDKYK